MRFPVPLLVHPPIPALNLIPVVTQDRTRIRNQVHPIPVPHHPVHRDLRLVPAPILVNGAMTNVGFAATGMTVDPLAPLGGVPALYEDGGTKVDSATTIL